MTTGARNHRHRHPPARILTTKFIAITAAVFQKECHPSEDVKVRDLRDVTSKRDGS